MPSSRRPMVALLAAATVLAACAGGSADDPPSSGTASGTEEAASAPPATATEDDAAGGSDGATPTEPDQTDEPDEPATDQSPDPDALRVGLVEAGSGFEAPVHAFAHAGRTFVVEQVGRVTELDSGQVWLDLTDRVRSGGEQGLLGVAVHPAGGHVVAHWTGGDGATVLATYPLVDGAPDVGSEVVVLRVDQPASNHNGGTVAFGPDGFAWLALGDGGAAGDRFGNGQDPGSLLGALLRVDLDDRTELRIPDDNPFVDGGGAPAVWAWGLRNPYRIALDDDQVYIADVGQNAVEEVTVLSLGQGGANLGWPQVEGDRCFTAGCDLGAYEPADVTYTHEETGGCSVIGGLVYEGAAMPALRGHFLYGDLCAGLLRTVRADGGDVVDELDLTGQVGSVQGVTGIGADAAGEPLLTFGDGRVLRLAPA